MLYRRMRNAKLLVMGVSGLTNELCKNLVLAGLGAMTILDDDLVTPSDIGCQFFLRQEDIGKNVNWKFIMIYWTGKIRLIQKRCITYIESRGSDTKNPSLESLCSSDRDPWVFVLG